ncbi:hypothetical protein KAS08_05720 [Candidatus Pacearchaeota archaeon]|nr:hypothetical protein [Candidatus Pacearchaeota archaeon]
MKNKIGILILGIILIGNVLAISGVSPGSYEIVFEPNLEKEFVFVFVIDGNRKVDVYAEGDLSNLVELDKSEIWERQDVKVKLTLPARLENPGINQIKIRAGEVVGIIKINVAYPNEFVELKLNAPDVNLGEVVDVEFGILSKGRAVRVVPRIEIYEVVGGVGEIINTINLEEFFVEAEKDFYLQLDTANYSAGDYYVVGVVEFGGEVADIKNSFRVGEKRVEIKDYTKSLKENKVGKFEINVTSFWNSDIREMYAEVKVVDSAYSFVTASVNLEAWEEKTLSAFFDVSQIYGYDKELEIILHYDGEETKETVLFEVLKGFDFILLIVSIFVLGIVGVLIWRGKIFLNNIKNNRMEDKK